MSTNNHNNPLDQLDAYLDGSLSAAEVTAFEQAASNDPQLQAELDLQNKIDASLSRSFALPTSPGLPADFFARAEQLAEEQKVTLPPTTDETVAPAAAAKSKRSAKNTRAIFAVIAAAVAWIVVGTSIYQSNQNSGYQRLAVNQIYQQRVDRGFKPDWVCEDDKQFAETFLKRQGQGLLVKQAPQVTLAGLAYIKGFSAQSTALLAHVEGKPVLVFAERLTADSAPKGPEWFSGVYMHRRELDDVVLYEVSPYNVPRVLEHFYTTDEYSL